MSATGPFPIHNQVHSITTCFPEMQVSHAFIKDFKPKILYAFIASLIPSVIFLLLITLILGKGYKL